MTRHHASPSDAETPAAAVFQMITGHYVSTAVNTAARLGIADAIGEEPADHLVLAERTGTHPEALLRLLSVLTSAGLLVQGADGRFALSGTGRLLRADGEESMHAVALLHGGPGHIQRWFELHDQLRTAPKTTETGDHGNPFAQMPPHVAEMFNKAMMFFAKHTAQAVIDAYDFTQFDKLADIGGGEGVLLASILRATPGLRGTLFDLPSLAEAGAGTLTEAGVSDRAEVISGDFFTAVPADCDGYLLKNVVHDWDDERSRLLLSNCRDVMKPGSRLLLVESVRPERFDTSFASRLTAHAHLSMLFNGGAERTEQEYADLLASSGLRLTSVTPVRPAWTGVASANVIEAVPS